MFKTVRNKADFLRNGEKQRSGEFWSGSGKEKGSEDIESADKRLAK